MPLENINGTVLHYIVKGEGIPIIFVHPPLLTGANFRYQQVQLSDEFKVITFDIRGHGQSGRSLVPITYSIIAEDIKQLMDGSVWRKLIYAATQQEGPLLCRRCSLILSVFTGRYW